MALIKNIDVKLEIKLGEAEMTVGELFDLTKDSLISLDRDVSSPVDVLLDGKVVARGNLVAVDNNFGVQITEVATK